MKQMTFADTEYAGKRKQTRKEMFLIEMDRVVPWKGLVALIDTLPRSGEDTAQLVTLFALSSLWMARRHLLTNAGEVRL